MVRGPTPRLANRQSATAKILRTTDTVEFVSYDAVCNDITDETIPSYGLGWFYISRAVILVGYNDNSDATMKVLKLKLDFSFTYKNKVDSVGAIIRYLMCYT